MKLKRYFSHRALLLSYLAAVLVGFSLGCGATTLALISFVLAVVLDIFSYFLSEKGRGGA